MFISYTSHYSDSLPSILVLVYFNSENTTMLIAQHSLLLCQHTVSYVQTQDLSASFLARQDQLLVISTLGDRPVSTRFTLIQHAGSPETMASE